MKRLGYYTSLCILVQRNLDTTMDRRSKLTLFHLLALGMFMVSCYLNVHGKESTGVILVDSEGEDGEVSPEEDNEEISDIFQPTDQWQVIKPGQAIPRGLHVRMDLSTGLKEAKLMEEDESQDRESPLDEGEALEMYEDDFNQLESDTLVYWKEGGKEGIAHSKQKYFTHDELKQAMKLFRANQDDAQAKEEEKKIRDKFRSIEDLKRDFEAMDMNVETDLEVMTKLVKRFNSTESTLEEKTTALHDLEYYVHQIDNAKDLASIGGLQLVIDALNSTEDGIKMEAAFVLGSAVQSNPHVQVKAIDGGALQLLLQMLSTTRSVPLRKKTMYAISSLLRMFPYAQQKFLDLGGLSTFSGLFKESDPPSVTLKVKAITLLHDLLVEKSNTIEYDNEEDAVHQMRKQQYGRVDLLSKMLDQNWCELIPTLLDVPDSDIQEKVLHAMEFLVEPCQHFSLDQTVLQRLLKLKANLDHLLHEESGDSSESYFYELSLLVNNLMSHISS